MPTTVKRALAAGAAGVAASLLLATPALAVKTEDRPQATGLRIQLLSDNEEVEVGYVETSRFQGRLMVTACDTHSDGYVITARVDPGSGVIDSFSTSGVDSCVSREYGYVRKFRLAWNNYASAWKAG